VLWSWVQGLGFERLLALVAVKGVKESDVRREAIERHLDWYSIGAGIQLRAKSRLCGAYSLCCESEVPHRGFRHWYEWYG
jgi:hypothetical protein